MRRALTVLIMLALMAAFAFGVNRFFASRQTRVAQASTPTQVKPAVVLPGTLFLSANGNLYAMRNGTFTDLHMPSNKGAWIQPAIVPGTSNVVAVARTDAYSEVYLVSDSGQIIQQLSHNQTKSNTLQLNHWMFWPRVTSDGTVYVSYDAPKSTSSYEIELAIWKGSMTGNLAAKQQTDPFSYTGGDVEVVPLSNGNLLYAKYNLNGNNIESRLAIQTKPLATPVYLTDPTDDCAQPALSPDGTMVAMICTNGTGLQSTSVKIATLTGTKLGTPKTLVGGCLCASPSWAPDGSGLTYLAPADATGHFQLWWIAGAAGATPKAPVQVTSGLDFDATSPAAWRQ
ncbi:MAG: TolB family protein [Candidatus Dormibacteria bacterium]